MLKSKPKRCLEIIAATVMGIALVSSAQAGSALKLGKSVSSADLWKMPSQVTFHIFDARDAEVPVVSQSFGQGEWSSTGELADGSPLRISAEVTALEFSPTGSSLWFDTEMDGVPVGERELVPLATGGVISSAGGFRLPDGYLIDEEADLGGGAGVSWTELTDKPPGFADDVDNIGDVWGDITGMPPGFADGVDNVGVAKEVDPQVGTNAANYIPRWKFHTLDKLGAMALPAGYYALATGSIYDNGSKLGVATTSLTGLLNLGTAPKLGGIGGTDCSLAGGGFLVAGSATGTSICLDNNEFMARNNGAASTLYLQRDGGTTQFNGNLDVRDSGNLVSILLQPDEVAGNGAAVKLYNNAGDLTIELDAEYGTSGTGKGTIFTQVLKITGGSDFSEQFSIDKKEYKIKPGMVVSIDPMNPGKLQISTEPYDSKVAGIISGAGGVDTGLMMGQAGTLADGDYPVALTGRVYTWVDASREAVVPGDMLTSSHTPGYAMKVTQHEKSTGAVIGKAMTPLAKGEEGLVLVLVSLQ